MTMKKRWLSAALAVQVGFAALLMWQVESPLIRTEPEDFVSTDLDALDRIVIREAEAELALKQVDGRWQLETESALPIDQGKLDRLLTDIAALKPGIPVVTRAANHARFEIADDNYYRHVELFAGGESIGSFYVGTTPAMRQAHIRMVGTDDVYALNFNRFELSTSSNGWLDKTLLQAQGITAIEHEDWRAEKNGEGWVLTRSDGTVVEGADSIKEVSSLVASLESMRVISEQTGLRKADLELVETYEATGGETYRYQFYEHEGDKLVSRDDLDAVFKVSNSQFSTVAELDFSNTQMADLDAQESLISEQEETDG